MRKSFQILTALAVAGVAFAGASAFTASNTMPSTFVAGYGEVVSTGATITTVTDNLDSASKSLLTSVVFASSTDVTGRTVTMTLKNGSSVVGTPYTCSLGAYAAGTMNITCATADNPPLNTFDTTGLTVV
ncbi:MAG: hypothetical protein QOE37_1597 [Microbacteriaceae bacterium]|nr:hypothetical protein [Microbacteriaceae bacterium]